MTGPDHLSEEPLAPVINMRQFLERSRGHEYSPPESLSPSELAAFLLSYWHHPAHSPERILDVINSGRVSRRDDDSWQLTVDALLRTAEDTGKPVLPVDGLHDVFLESILATQEDEAQQRAIERTLRVYTMSQSELDPQPSQQQTRIVLFKIRSAHRTGRHVDESD